MNLYKKERADKVYTTLLSVYAVLLIISTIVGSLTLGLVGGMYVVCFTTPIGLVSFILTYIIYYLVEGGREA